MMPRRWSPKMLREYLCSQQYYAPDGFTKAEIQHLIDVLDLHRPLASNGKHGNLHTPTCGCDDRDRSPAPEPAEPPHRIGWDGVCRDCGHEVERHGPESGGCIECRCRLVTPEPTVDSFTTCPKCRQSYDAQACGPTHELIAQQRHSATPEQEAGNDE